MKNKADKRTTVKEAVAAYLNDNDSFTIAGITPREPLAMVYEIIRQGQKDLTLVTATNTDSANMK